MTNQRECRILIEKQTASSMKHNVIQLMNALKKSGVKSVGLVTEPVSN